MDKTVIVIVLIVLAIGAGFLVWNSVSPINPAPPAQLPDGIVLFYGDTCPHCKNVDDFLLENNVEEKVKITRLEVYNNQSNAQLLVSTAVFCGIDTSQGMGVPFLYDGRGKCYIGDVDTINFFKNEAGIE